jgi:hypothetical protein
MDIPRGSAGMVSAWNRFGSRRQLKHHFQTILSALGAKVSSAWGVAGCLRAYVSTAM